ncbi:serine hydrolase domain-containing protein [Atopococcus tabaci]|uniref:serine hydrolase domain-containing protein n=1 Tax=Atopococcus tabaci TaxID=269774 RepID=UPI0004242C35|nr:serine hydrolase [Atopococcus tabaci]
METLNELAHRIDFSGSVRAAYQGETLEASFGFRNRPEKLENTRTTRFGIASGCKIFTAVAVCQLVEQGKLAFDTRLTDCLDLDFPHFDKEVTLHHLLTHTSGVPDYFDEEVMEDFEELWVEKPMYTMRNGRDFLPFFQNEPMKNQPGERFAYNNAGYILLGLVVEEVSGQLLTDYIEEHIFQRAGMTRSGYFELDRLPSETAQGYIELEDGTWKTNAYALPVKGGADGGAFVTAEDMERFWHALLSHQLLKETTTHSLLQPHTEAEEDNFYGYGVWIDQDKHGIQKYHVMGYDPGVNFHSAYYPGTSAMVTVCSNVSEGAYDMLEEVETQFSLS